MNALSMMFLSVYRRFGTAAILANDLLVSFPPQVTFEYTGYNFQVPHKAANILTQKRGN